MKADPCDCGTAVGKQNGHPEGGRWRGAGKRNFPEPRLSLVFAQVDLDDLELVFEAGLKLMSIMVVAHLGDVAEAFDAFRDLHEGAELRGAQNLAVYQVADAVGGEERLPDIGLELLDAKAEAAILRLDAENDCLDLFAFLDHFGGVLDALGPAQVGDMD